MELEKNWGRILEVARQSKKANRFFSIATVDAQGNPHITPIGHVFFRSDMTAYYFDEYSEAMPKNFESNRNICLMAVNSSASFWLKSLRYAPEVRERAVRMVLEHQHEYLSQWSAIGSIASKIGCTPETLRKWVRRSESDHGMRGGMTTADRDQFKALERENRELKRANEILRKASAYFAQAEGVRQPSLRRPK